MSGQTILVVDDNEDNRAMLERWLRRRGYVTHCAEDGRAAIAMTESHRPDLVFMDISMPVMSGIDATRAIRANPETSGTPVIALTAHAMMSDRAACIEAGCNAVATKPIDFQELQNLLQAHLGQSIPQKEHVP